MRYPTSSRFSYRNVLIAAALAAGLGVSPAYAKTADVPAARPQRGYPTPDVPMQAPPGSELRSDQSQAR